MIVKLIVWIAFTLLLVWAVKLKFNESYIVSLIGSLLGQAVIFMILMIAMMMIMTVEQLLSTTS